MASGLVLIDKPKGWTSHDVVAKMRGIAGTRRVGHAGTLDPTATGLLLLGINAGTKLLTFLVGATKTYEATIRLGASTITDDAEGEVTSTADGSAVDALTLEKIESALNALRGEIMQVPSSVSAIKVDGERAYAKVRGGDEVKLAARPITVSRFEVISDIRLVSDGDSKFIDFDALIDCSSGTYIRALARDLGSALQVGGHLTALRRTRIGTYKIEDAQQLDGLSSDSLSITSMFEAVKESFELRELSEQEVVDLRHGKRISANDCVGKDIAGVNGQRLIAMLEKADLQLKSSVVFVEDSHD
jgi:tRNA pseudouridine55 synthase